ncbi:hypothetical protein HAZT_HAZT008796, partial [Hyalella azteca]
MAHADFTVGSRPRPTGISQGLNREYSTSRLGSKSFRTYNQKKAKQQYQQQMRIADPYQSAFNKAIDSSWRNPSSASASTETPSAGSANAPWVLRRKRASVASSPSDANTPPPNREVVPGSLLNQAPQQFPHSKNQHNDSFLPDVDEDTIDDSNSGESYEDESADRVSDTGQPDRVLCSDNQSRLQQEDSFLTSAEPDFETWSTAVATESWSSVPSNEPGCGRSYSTKGNLATHARTHAGDLQHRCHVCDKHFLTSYALRTHVVTHSQSRPFTCESCGQTFTQQYRCDVALCGKSFALPHQLTRHRKLHQVQINPTFSPASCLYEQISDTDDALLPGASTLSADQKRKRSPSLGSADSASPKRSRDAVAAGRPVQVKTSSLLEELTARADICRCDPCQCDPSKGNECSCNPVADPCTADVARTSLASTSDARTNEDTTSAVASTSIVAGTTDFARTSPAINASDVSSTTDIARTNAVQGTSDVARIHDFKGTSDVASTSDIIDVQTSIAD